MKNVALHTIEICAGVAMLGEGLRAGLAHLGIPLRTVCYVEREAYAAAVLAARIEEGSLDGAPVWSDLLTFDARRWDGAVDGIVAGFPCQDLSLAGKRAGLDGKRSGLFFDILDIADRSGAWFLWLENVAGIASATATVVDEATAAEITGESYRPAGTGSGGADERIQEEDGVVLERAAARVVGELADRGWHAEWLTLSASDVGASHGRERWFCFAWRTPMDDTECTERGTACATGAGGQQGDDRGRSEAHSGIGESVQVLGDAQRGGQQAAREFWPRRGEPDLCRPSAGMAHTAQHGRNQGRPESSREQGRSDAAVCGGAMADPGCGDARGIEHIAGASGITPEYHAGSAAVADTCSPGLPQRIRGGELREQPTERDPGSDLELHGRPFFAPGPADPAWAGLIQREPYLAPALEPDFRGDVDGMAFAMDESRAQRLKCIGNGVVALQAAAAFVVLARRAGLSNLKGQEI